MYTNALDKECYAEILIFLKHGTHNLAVIQGLSVLDNGITEGITSDIELIDKHLGKEYFLNHVVSVARSHFHIIPITFFKEKVMLVECKGTQEIYVSKFPNLVERD